MIEHVNPIGVECPVDWGRVPEWANWVAVELNGEIYCYSCKPKWVPDLNAWITDIDYRRNTEYKHELLVTEYSATYIPNISGPILLWRRPKRNDINWGDVPD